MEEIFKITKDEKRANALKEMAKDRLKNMSSLKEPYRIIEEYYERAFNFIYVFTRI
jgi:seryl-tRNA synthetase